MCINIMLFKGCQHLFLRKSWIHENLHLRDLEYNPPPQGSHCEFQFWAPPLPSLLTLSYWTQILGDSSPPYRAKRKGNYFTRYLRIFLPIPNTFYFNQEQQRIIWLDICSLCWLKLLFFRDTWTSIWLKLHIDNKIIDKFLQWIKWMKLIAKIYMS